MNPIPTFSKLDLVDYLRALADWIEQEDLTVPEVSAKTWSNIGTVQINFRVTP